MSDERVALCKSIRDEDDKQCDRPATKYVRGRHAPWSGNYCDEHAERVVWNMGEDKCIVRELP